MIYTVTFNPALDYVMFLEKLQVGEVNRTSREAIVWGGKGINVASVLHTLGADTKALGFIAGFTGQALKEGVEAMGVQTDFLVLPEGLTRINIKVKHGEETEINGQGPVITEEALEAFCRKVDTLTAADTLVLAGSIPNCLPADVYEQILKRISGKGIRTVVDASGELLLRVIPYHPFLIKPNHQELGELFHTNCESGDLESIAFYAGKLQEQGAENVLVSMAGEGSFLLTADGKTYRMKTPTGKVVNSVGAGDSMVAGFLAGYDRSGSYEEALRLGTAAGSATAFSEGLADAALIERLYQGL